MLQVSDEGECTTEVVNALRRDQNEKLLQKQRNLRDKSFYPATQMSIDNLVHKKNVKKRKYFKQKQKNQRGRQRSKLTAKSLSKQVEHYDLPSSLAQKNAGIKTGQLLRGDANKAAAVARCIFQSRSSKRMLAVEVSRGKRTSKL